MVVEKRFLIKFQNNLNTTNRQTAKIQTRQRDPVRNVIVVSLDCTLATEHGGSVQANTGNSGQFAQRESNL